jgi:phosphosulfolactate synthase (CoM biosynthesis protein A)
MVRRDQLDPREMGAEVVAHQLEAGAKRFRREARDVGRQHHVVETKKRIRDTGLVLERH